MHSPLFITLGIQLCVLSVLIFLVWFVNVFMRQEINFLVKGEPMTGANKYGRMVSRLNLAVVIVSVALGAQLAMTGITVYRIWFM